MRGAEALRRDRDSITSQYLERIGRYLPDVPVDGVDVNGDGRMNDVLVINGERVFRFAKDEDWILACLRQEVRTVALVAQYVDLPIPAFEVHAEDCVSYPLLPGQGLTRHDLLCQPEPVQDAVAEQLAVFLRQLHGIPQEVLAQHRIPATNATQTPAQYRADYEELERDLFPLASSQVRRIITGHYAPLLQGWLDLDYLPALIHADLGQQHILFDTEQGRVSGVLDFGVAGIGDPAHDFGVLLNCYGESFVRRMARYTAEIADLIDRARFMSFLAEPSWVLRGLRSQDPFWFTVSLGTARDVRPVGTRWD